jgi:protein SCO1/2/putative membrane protein
MSDDPVLPQHRLAWIALIAFIIALFGAAFVNRLNADAGKLPVRRQLNDFELIDQNNEAVSRKSLKGHVWIAGFIFTSCSVNCVQITNGMVELNKKLAAAPGIQLVSFSMDPDTDTPPVLLRYAKAHGAESPRWHFVTGKKDDIYRLTREDFQLAVVESGGSKDEPIVHSSHLALVDRTGRIRGYYSGLMPDEVQKLAVDAQALENELGVSALPTLNAALNAVSTVFLLVGFYFIRRRQIVMHQTTMMCAGVTSAAFLISYLVYHAQVGSVKFTGQGPVRYVYFSILISHVFLAAAIAVLVPLTFRRAFQGDFERHRRIARITFPIWLYVSITGVVVYLMLYHFPVT